MYKHTCKIELSNGTKGELKFDMPSVTSEWNGRVKGAEDEADRRVNALAVKSFVIAAQAGARACKTIEAAQKHMRDFVYGEKASPKQVTVDAGLKWTPEMLKHFAENNITVA